MKANKDYVRTLCERFVLDKIVLDVLKRGNQNEDQIIMELLRSNLKVTAILLALKGFSEKEVQSECDMIINQYSDEELWKKSYHHYEMIYNNLKNNGRI
jgi:GH35 family endo-1,4-beta-xylanase